jgi:hypothetical protein
MSETIEHESLAIAIEYLTRKTDAYCPHCYSYVGDGYFLSKKQADEAASVKTAAENIDAKIKAKKRWFER